jgi:hypothetical protein
LTVVVAEAESGEPAPICAVALAVREREFAEPKLSADWGKTAVMLMPPVLPEPMEEKVQV